MMMFRLRWLPISALLTAAGLPMMAVAQEEKKREQAPETYRAKFETSKGDFVVEVHREWAPHGADRFYELVRSGFYDEARFFRVVPGFMVQFGMAADPQVHQQWTAKRIPDDPVRQSNKRGFITFAKPPGPNSRTTQVFINYGDNRLLDEQGFAPFGRVVEGMEVVDKINAEYGERPSQRLIERQGNEYLKREFPRLDYIKKARIIDDKGAEKKKS